jgi:redox-sensitive bicupin YhaK (pirin superfamily)
MSHPINTLDIRRGDDRGTTDLGWLHSRHSFSFGRYLDADRMAYRSLRVLNDDVVAPGGGFGEHGHDNMEIISWVLSGVLEHADSAGHAGKIVPGDVQVMSARPGHSSQRDEWLSR